MMQRRMKVLESNKRIHRFPRYPDAADIAELAKRIWKKPRFTVKQEEDYTEFNVRFKFSIPEKIRERQPASYTLLFELNNMNWKRALRKGYSKAYYGSDRVPQLLNARPK